MECALCYWVLSRHVHIDTIDINMNNITTNALWTLVSCRCSAVVVPYTSGAQARVISALLCALFRKETL